MQRSCSVIHASGDNRCTPVPSGWRRVEQYGQADIGAAYARRLPHDYVAGFLRQVIDSVGYEPRVVITDKLELPAGQKAGPAQR
jgi:hypothetical protein